MLFLWTLFIKESWKNAAQFHTNIKAQLFSTLMIIKIFLEQQIGILKWFLKDCGFWSLNEHKTLKEDFKNFFKNPQRIRQSTQNLQNIKKRVKPIKNNNVKRTCNHTYWLLIDIEININTVNLTDCTNRGQRALKYLYLIYTVCT